MRCHFHAFAAAWLIAALSLAAGCSSTQTSVSAPSADKCQIGVNSVPSAFTATGGPGSLSITTARDCPWSISVDAGWVSITGDRGGQGDAAIPYSVAPNTVPTPRSAALVVGGQSVAVSQAAAPCQFRLSRGGDSIGSSGGRLSVDLSTLTGCPWTAASRDGWISLVSGQSGSSSGAVAMTVAANAGGARVGHVSIGGQDYAVSQDAAPAPPAPTPPPAPAPTPTPSPTPSPTPTPTPTPPPTPPPPPPSPEPRTVELTGIVLLLSGRCPDVSFVIGLTSIEADRSTDFHKSKCGDLRIGRIATVQGVVQPNLTIKATRIETDK